MGVCKRKLLIEFTRSTSQLIRNHTTWRHQTVVATGTTADSSEQHKENERMVGCYGNKWKLSTGAHFLQQNKAKSTMSENESYTKSVNEWEEEKARERGAHKIQSEWLHVFYCVCVCVNVWMCVWLWLCVCMESSKVTTGTTLFLAVIGWRGASIAVVCVESWNFKFSHVKFEEKSIK